MQHTLQQIDWTRFTGRGTPASDPGAEAVRDRCVLITGAGGSIGSALARRVAQHRPAQLVLLDQAEEGLSHLARELAEQPFTAIVGDVRDQPMLHSVFHTHQPVIVFHAAAYKHVPLMETNPVAAVEVNALGTGSLLEAALQGGCERLVLLSTDKAVAPQSIMGASKRIAEILALTTTGMAISVLRLGNVLASSGSLARLLWQQIATGGPLTLTDRDAVRFFITLEEAVHSLLSALALSPDPLIWAPEMGSQRRIPELATFLQQAATAPDVLPVRYTGLRPGDKLLEALLGAGESFVNEGSSGALRAIASPLPAPLELEGALGDIRRACATREITELVRAVRLLVPDYQPSTAIQPRSTSEPVETRR